MFHLSFKRAELRLSKSFLNVVTSALVRTPDLENSEIQVQFSRQRIEVNSASLKLTSEKRFKILRQFAIE
jgi:hypothetical protein